MFRPDANESPQHRAAKERLVQICREIGMDAEIEVPVETESRAKTYYCDVLARFKVFESQVILDLEVEDFDHTKHDFDDADNKVKELARYFIKVIWFKSSQLVGKRAALPSDVLVKIFNEMIDGQYRNPRMNV